uniref:Ubiquitin-like protease family profile domain-containing protein n=1 Tax=Eutreptiella gymnastica TaxID=73025 RepID=A0A7S1NSQ0_9EUGL
MRTPVSPVWPPIEEVLLVVNRWSIGFTDSFERMVLARHWIRSLRRLFFGENQDVVCHEVFHDEAETNSAKRRRHNDWNGGSSRSSVPTNKVPDSRSQSTIAPPTPKAIHKEFMSSTDCTHEDGGVPTSQTLETGRNTINATRSYIEDVDNAEHARPSCGSSIVRPKAQKTDPRKEIFCNHKAPTCGSIFTPPLELQSVQDATPHGYFPRKRQRERIERERWETLRRNIELRSVEGGLRDRQHFNAADCLSRQCQVLAPPQRMCNLCEDDTVEWPHPITPRAASLGTRQVLPSDPLGSIFSDELFANWDDGDELFMQCAKAVGINVLRPGAIFQGAASWFTNVRLGERSAFKFASTSDLSAQQKLQLLDLRWSGAAYASKEIMASREADIFYEKDRIMHKHIMKKLEDQLDKVQKDRQFVKNTYKDLVDTMVRSVCQRVLPQKSLADMLQQYKASKETTCHIKNKEFLPLTQDDLDACDRAWDRMPHEDEVLVKERVNDEPYELLRKDFRTLAGTTWLNDEVINKYVQLLKSRGTRPGFPRCYFFDSFFYTQLTSRGYKSVARRTKKVDLFSMEKVIIPVHLSNHWTSAVINLRERRFEFYDSLGSEGRHHLEKLQQYIEQEHENKKGTKLDTSDWAFYTPETSVPQQNNFSDCGVFSCKFMNWCSQDMPFSFSQADMPYFRKRFVVELLNAMLL